MIDFRLQKKSCYHKTEVVLFSEEAHFTINDTLNFAFLGKFRKQYLMSNDHFKKVTVLAAMII